MLDKEKLFIIFHVGVGNLSKKEAVVILNEFINMKQIRFDESVKTIILPDGNQDYPCVHVEVINPVTLSDEEYNRKVVSYVEEAEQAIKDFEEQSKK